MLQGFKDFISRGNVIELAVGVVIGAAFGQVVNALVDGILNPVIAGIFGQANFSSVLAFDLGEATVMPGMLLTAVIQFLLTAAGIYFMVIIPMNKMAEMRKKKEGEAPVEVAAPTTEDLLAEIRDLLARK